MSSEIKGPGGADLRAVDLGNARRAERPGDSGKPPASGRPGDGASAVDHVRLTDTAASLRRIESALAAEPVVDSARVAAVREAVENGSYAPDPVEVADRLVGFERGLRPGDGKV